MGPRRERSAPAAVAPAAAQTPAARDAGAPRRSARCTSRAGDHRALGQRRSADGARRHRRRADAVESVPRAASQGVTRTHRMRAVAPGYQAKERLVSFDDNVMIDLSLKPGRPRAAPPPVDDDAAPRAVAPRPARERAGAPFAGAARAAPSLRRPRRRARARSARRDIQPRSDGDGAAAAAPSTPPTPTETTNERHGVFDCGLIVFCSLASLAAPRAATSASARGRQALPARRRPLQRRRFSRRAGRVQEGVQPSGRAPTCSTTSGRPNISCSTTPAALKTMERYLAETGTNAPHRAEVETTVEVLRGRVGRVVAHHRRRRLRRHRRRSAAGTTPLARRCWSRSGRASSRSPARAGRAGEQARRGRRRRDRARRVAGPRAAARGVKTHGYVPRRRR